MSTEAGIADYFREVLNGECAVPIPSAATSTTARRPHLRLAAGVLREVEQTLSGRVDQDSIFDCLHIV
jgi:hypothetical protein